MPIFIMVSTMLTKASSHKLSWYPSWSFEIGLGSDFIQDFVWGYTSQDPPSAPPVEMRIADRLSSRDVVNAMLGTDALLYLEEGDYATYRHIYLMPLLTGVRTPTMRPAVAPSLNSTAALCGNGNFTIHTGAGLIVPEIQDDGKVRVDMGEPILKASNVPTKLPANEGQSVVKSELNVDGVTWNVTCVSMGNPHCVTFGTKGSQVDELNLAQIGPKFEHHEMFPARTNLVLNISVEEGTVTVSTYVPYYCYNMSWIGLDYWLYQVNLTGTPFTFSATENRFITIGCDIAGYIGDSDDIDECLDQTMHRCEGMCTNTQGNYTCHCPLGMSGDGKVACRGFRVTTLVAGSGAVYKEVLANGSLVAVKKPNVADKTKIKHFQREVIKQEFQHEISIVSQVNHKNGVKLLGLCLETKFSSLIYEFISNGSLFDHLHVKRSEMLKSWANRLRIAVEISLALDYLHSLADPPIIHRDVKSMNILLDEKFTAKVSDFGASVLIPFSQSVVDTKIQGTHGYLDPEYLIIGLLTIKSDLYSFGVVLMELLTGQKPILKQKNPEENVNFIQYFISSVEQKKFLGF
ncbi:Wall-associated receptor kinase 5 [Camellia lanceoleosa]|uniref:Wall-associated receptor kinase 5 n=1 Tax=Camellia lanceoleosa TaxID=1840588 RepID=A0ACC0G7E8_9ERIC|nr:Wall-associated receptor kinase 5 [Camellia lanceoleosa]